MLHFTNKLRWIVIALIAGALMGIGWLLFTQFGTRTKLEVNGLDLRTEEQTIRTFLVSSAHRYAARFPKKTVTGLQLHYSMNNGFLEVSYWMNPDYEPFYQDVFKAQDRDMLKLPHWESFYQRWFEEDTETIDLDGSILRTQPGRQGGMRVARGGTDVNNAIGRMLRGILTEGRTDGLFRELPMSAGMRFGIEDDDEGFHWEEPVRP
jgi:hypothetical protein